MLKENPSFDMMNQMHTGLPLLRQISQTVNKTPATFLKSYLPLRTDNDQIYLHQIESVVQ